MEQPLPRLARRPPRWSFDVLAAVLVVIVAGAVWMRLPGAAPIRALHQAPQLEAKRIPPVAPKASFATITPPSTAKTRKELHKLAALGLPIFCGGARKPYVALTFDDGPGPYSAKALEILKKANAPASFFLVGKLVAEPGYHPVVKEEGDWATLGDHTWDHVSVTGSSRARLVSQVVRTKRKIQKVSGRPVSFFRPPYGYFDSGLGRFLSSRGLIDVLWSLDSRDSDGATEAQILSNVQGGLSAGDIVELHENRGTTLAVLPQILQLLQEKGLQPVTLSELLALDPPSVSQVENRTCP